MDHPVKISIIILMHNNVPMTLQCLKSLSDAVAGLNCEVMILDNGSTEDISPLHAYQNIFSSLKLIRSSENLSFSTGNNRMVSAAAGRILLFLNNDVFPERESIGRLIDPIMKGDKIAATGGKLLFPGATSVQHAGIKQMLWEHPSNYGVGATPLDSRIVDERECFALSGAMLCVDRNIFEAVGGFDERYIWGTEDIDLCLKIRARGRKAVYCPSSVAVHMESATLKKKKNGDAEGNCRLYRQVWDSVLVPAEQRYIELMKRNRIKRVAVFGMGTAARGLAKLLNKSGIEIVAFTGSELQSEAEFLGRPAVPISFLPTMTYDRLMVASQYYFAVEPEIRKYDPTGAPIYPVLN